MKNENLIIKSNESLAFHFHPIAIASPKEGCLLAQHRFLKCSILLFIQKEILSETNYFSRFRENQPWKFLFKAF